MAEVSGHQNGPLETVRVREAVGIVDSREQLEQLVERLTTQGFDRSTIDLMASRLAVYRKLKEVYLDPAAAAEAPGVPRRELILPSDEVSSTALVFGTLIAVGALGVALPIVASGGALAAAALGGLGGGLVAGRVAKSLRDRIVERFDKVDLEEELRQGGLVVFVRLRDREHEEKAVAIMRDCGVRKVHVHEVDIPKTLDDIPLANINPDPLLGPETLGG